MKKVILCSRMPHENSYVGGVVSIINHYFEHSELFEKNGYKLELFDYQMKRWFPIGKIDNCLYGFFQIRAVLKKLKTEHCDVFNIHTSREFLFLKDILLACAVSKRYKIKVVVTVHVGSERTVFNRIGFAKSFCIKVLNKYVNKTVFLSQEIRDEFVKLGMDFERTEVLYNFHCLSASGKNLPKEEDMLYLLFVGAIHREKGIIELLEAVNNLNKPNIHLDICGKLTDPGIADRYNELVCALGERVKENGYVRGVEKTALFERADVLVLPSYHEGMPLVVLEAIASGCAVISTPVGTTPEVLSDKNALWVKVADVKQLETAIDKLYSQRTVAEKMKNNNILMSQNFTIEKNIETLCKIYNV